MTQHVDVMQGTLDLLILKALSLESGHGWGITSRIERISGGTFKVGQGSLYPALHRFEKRGWVASYWRTTENNRIARYYELSPAGKHALANELERWHSYATAMGRVASAH